MSDYVKVNIDEVEDLAPQFGMGEMGEARFARSAIGGQGIGLAYYRLNPSQRLGFGHRHAEDEEAQQAREGAA